MVKKTAVIYPQLPDREANFNYEIPLGPGFLDAILKREGFDSRLFLPIRHTKRSFIEELIAFEPDYVLLSLMTHQVPFGLEIAQALKQRSKPTVIAGGYHPSLDTDFIDEEYIDYVIVGEGLLSLPRLLSALSNNSSMKDIRGVKSSSRTITRPSELSDVCNLPFIHRNKELYALNDKNSLFVHETASQTKWQSVIYSFGCPYACTFCPSSTILGTTLRYRPVDEVFEEIKRLSHDYEANYIGFEDLSFGIDSKKTTLLLHRLNELKSSGLNYWAFANVKTVLHNQKLFSFAKQVGFRSLTLGIEGFDDLYLQKIRKPQTAKEIKTALTLLQQLDYTIHSTVMIGFPWQDEHSIISQMKAISLLPIDQLTVTIATPFPGTAWYEGLKYSGRLLESFEQYTCNNLVFDHPTIRPERMKELQQEFYRKYYSHPQWLTRMEKKLKKQKNLESFITSVTSLL